MKCVVEERSSVQDVVTLGLNCFTEGLESKSAVRASILEHIGKHYAPVESPVELTEHELHLLEELPLSVLELIHRAFGVAFVGNDGTFGLARGC